MLYCILMTCTQFVCSIYIKHNFINKSFCFKIGHYPGHFGEFSGFSKMNFYRTTHSITTNVIDLERTRRAASNGTPMSTLKMKLQGIMTLQRHEKKIGSKMVNLLVHYNLSASSRTCSEKQLLHRYTPGVHLQYVLISRGHREHLCCGYLDLELTNRPSLNFLLGGTDTNPWPVSSNNRFDRLGLLLSCSCSSSLLM